MRQLNNGPTQQLATALDDWGRLQHETVSFLQEMREYYSQDLGFSAQFEENTNAYEKRLEAYKERHSDVDAKSRNARDKLQVKVRSSGNEADRMKHHGLIAVITVALIGGGIGAGIGYKMGWVSALVGALVGFFGLGGAAVILFLFMRWKYVRRHDKWQTEQQNNEEALARVPLIDAKTEQVSAIIGSIRDIEERTMEDEIPILRQKIDNYLNN